MKNFFLAIIFTGIASCWFATAQTQYNGWIASFNTIKTGKKTSIHNDIQWRSTDNLKQTQTLLLRGGLNVHLSSKWVATAGYAFISNKRIVGNIAGQAPEHRLWEQVVYNHKLNPLLVSHRLRLEQRFISKSVVHNNTLQNDGSAYANRLRYFIRNVLPFDNEPVFKKGIFVALQNEVFVNIGNTANVNGEFFDQNRLYLAVGCRIHPSFDIEAGYMNQYINGRSSSFTNNHVAQLAGYLRL